MPEGAVYVGRPSKWGNPFKAEIGISEYAGRMRARLLFEAYVWDLSDDLCELRGKDLVCWCPLDQPCHADILLDLANR